MLNHKKVRVGVIGCGNRGSAYSDYILNHPEEAEIAYVCDILPERLEKVGNKYGVPEATSFGTLPFSAPLSSFWRRMQLDGSFPSIMRRMHPIPILHTAMCGGISGISVPLFLPSHATIWIF